MGKQKQRKCECGTILAEGEIFCHSCGKKNELKKKRPMGLIIAIVAIVAILICGIGGYLIVSSLGKNNTNQNKVSLLGEKLAKSGYINEDGFGYTVLENGELIVIKKSITSMMVTPDEKKVAYIDEDGTLMWKDLSSNEEKTIASDCNSIRYIKNSGVIYKDNDGKSYRYLFDKDDTVELGKLGYDYRIATNTLSFAYAISDKSDIYLLAEGDNEPEKIGTYSNELDFSFISDDGMRVVWLDDSLKIKYYCNGNVDSIGKLQNASDYAYINTKVSPDENQLLVGSKYGEDIYLLEKNGDVKSIRLGNNLGDTVVYTEKGLYKYDNSNPEEFYALIENGTSANLYWLSAKDEREKLVSNVNDFSINDGKICYLKQDGDLYSGTIKNNSLSDEKKISGDVADFVQLADGNIVFEKNVTEIGYGYEGDLYYYSIKDAEMTKIASDVYYSYWYNCVEASSDGKTIYYYTEYEDNIHDTYTDVATLWKYTMSEGAKKISSDVYIYSIMNYYASGLISTKDICFEKYSTMDKNNEKCLFNICQYRNDDIEILVKDVK